MRKLIATSALSAAMVLTATAAVAGGPADKATGSGTWTNTNDDVFTAEFNAHEEKDSRPAKGDLHQAREDGGGSFSVDVSGVVIGEDYACFWGTTYDATGLYEDRNDDLRWTFVTDQDEPGTDVDTFRGSWSAVPAACKDGSLNPSTNTLSGGNIQVHVGKAHTS